MRPIGQLESEEQARTLADYLFIRGVETQVEPGKGNAWVVWVVDEERVDEAKALLSRFRSMPDAEEFHQASAAAAERRRGEKKAALQGEKTGKRPGAFRWPLQGGG